MDTIEERPDRLFKITANTNAHGFEIGDIVTFQHPDAVFSGRAQDAEMFRVEEVDQGFELVFVPGSWVRSTDCVPYFPTELSSADQELMGIDAILDARGNKYGDYETRAAIEWTLHQAAMDSPNFPVLSPGQKTSVFMILHKLSRILAGDPNHEDSWADIAGYAQLIVGGDTLRDN